MYEYQAKCIKIIDGDTIDCEVDLGFHIKAYTRFRIRGIDAPENRGKEREEGLKVTKWLRHQLFTLVDYVPVPLRIVTYKADSFGRWLCDVYYRSAKDSHEINLAEEMLHKGFAKRYETTKG